METLLQDEENKRLKALYQYNILDTLPEQVFDDITYLASYICESPIALISLVDEKRQWFKSKHRFNISETARDVSFCAHAIYDSKPFVVRDATKDERFARNPLVTSDPNIRFYAGAPLITSDGHALGTLCVIDHKSREISPKQLKALKALSRQVIQLLDERRLAQKLAQANNDIVYLRQEILSDHNFGEIIGNSEALKQVMHKTGQVAETDATVLIVGETGTGKELIARATHDRSLRKSRPMIKVNCATLPANLIESELFGHEKGSFTGAHSTRVGRFEMANGSTIFLDEIGELPLDLQSKLLRVLQEGEFERLGSSRTIKVNVRVIAATNRDLEKACQEGTFRSDLYYRLHVFPIVLPPLRERKEDIPLLVNAFVESANKRLGKSIKTISQKTLEGLQNYSWYGNIRELQSVIERAAIITQGSQLQLVDDLKPQQQTSCSLKPAPSPPPVIKQSISDDQLLTLEEIEKCHIIRVLEKTHWRIEGENAASDILGLNPSTLRSRLRKLGIKRTK
jgi:transcriptional regulator with GAF, ATPase, and Fis domain